MIQAVLSNKQHPEYGVATVPFPIVKDEYDHILALLEPLGIGDAVKQDCHIEEVRGDFPALRQMELTNANLDELDYLAKRLDSFDEYEKAQFQGMASRLEFHSADEFINLTFCCQKATVITDFSDMEALGRRHFLTMNGGAASPEEMQGKDFRKIAQELLDQQVGRVTHYGVVYDNDFEMTELYDGRRFPEYHYEDCVLEMEMSLRFAPVENPAAYLYLPMTQSQIERAMLRAGIDSYGDMSLQFMESKLPDEIDAILDFENESLSDLNEMCRTIEPLSSLECAMLGAAVLLAQPECAAQVRQLAENLDQFDFVLGVHSPKEYGEYMIKESEHFQYDENLAEFYDFEKYGRQRVEQEGGVFNQRGYIAYQGTLSLDELMQGDPAENMSPQMGGME